MTDGRSTKAIFPRRAEGPIFVVYTSAVAFTVYFAMYAFRKPFAAAAFEGSTFGIDTKTALVLAQLLGYTLSKFWGVRWLSGLQPQHLRRALWLSVFCAWLTLVAFAMLPSEAQVGMMFLNGLPLGLVWGLVVRRLEGRRSSEILLAGLSASFIVASGAVKDVARVLMEQGVSEAWMPAAVGLLFLPVYGVAVFLLSRLPPPNEKDVAARVERTPMTGAQRGEFLRRFPVVLIALFLLYFVLTAYRDFRDAYALEMFEDLGYEATSGLFTKTELPVAVFVLLTLAGLNMWRGRRSGMMAMLVVMTVGTTALACATWLRQNNLIDGQQWMILCGVGSYLAYVPFGSMLFERLVAVSGTAGTAVFAIYIADALGYTGSILLQLFRDVFVGDQSRLVFFDGLSWTLGLGGIVLMAIVAFRLHTAMRD